MEAIKLTQVVETDGEIVVKGLPWRKGQRVELTLVPGSAPGEDEQLGMTARELARSELVGLWEHRTDIGDSSEFARRLREKAQAPRYTL
jgi:hypothetical protein